MTRRSPTLMKKTCPFTWIGRHRWIALLLLVILAAAGIWYVGTVRSPSLEEGTASRSILDVTDDTLDGYLSQGKPVVLEFYTKSCPYCVKMEPELSELNAKYSNKILVLKMNAELYPGTASAYKIQGVPTLLFFDAEGKLKKASPGYRKYSEIEGLLSDLGLIE
jgi:thioredoxin 1